MITLLATAVLFPFASHAQTGEDALRFSTRFPGTGVRATALSGAGTAGVSDFSALFSNPAGLAYAKHSSFSGALSTLSNNDAGLYQLGIGSNGLDNTSRDTGIDQLAYIYKVPAARGSLVFGASFSKVGSYERTLDFMGNNGLNSMTDFFMPVSGEYEIEHGAGPDDILDTEDDTFSSSFSRDLSFIAFETFGIDFDRARFDAGEIPFLPAVTTGTVQQSGTVSESGSKHEFNVGVGTEAFKDVMVGISLNIPFSRYRFSRIFEETDAENANNGANGTTDFDYLKLLENINSDVVGVNVRAGFSAKVGNGLRAGVNVETPTYFTINESFGTQLDTYFDNGDHFVYGDAFDQTAGSGDFEYRVTTPWRLSGGLAFKSGNIGLFADAEFVDWTQMEMNADGVSFASENFDIQRTMEAVVNTRFGAEFGFGDLVLRAGYALQPDPRKSAFTTINRDHTFYSAGLGYRFSEQFLFDVAWSREEFDDEYLPYSEVTDAPVVSESISRDRVLVGVKVLF